MRVVVVVFMDVLVMVCSGGCESVSEITGYGFALFFLTTKVTFRGDAILGDVHMVVMWMDSLR
ncbi:hypothetical protein MtrunA17_Chr5g0427161 [Medicago truncatula]|uniref:Transmembrane protein n=1 Tax=Medicago truncatula TaxID=3880 RepID=A0A396HXT7_MEDTR|nr:hypothetical protein MtrunA17_Chr5g0427161 [Medicago truncatula]